MTKFKSGRKMSIGFFRSGKPMEIPLGLDYNARINFIDALDVSSSFDTACVIEFLLSGANNMKTSLAVMELERWHNLFMKKINVGHYESEAGSLKVATSVDRIKFGRSLSHGSSDDLF